MDFIFIRSDPFLRKAAMCTSHILNYHLLYDSLIPLPQDTIAGYRARGPRAIPSLKQVFSCSSRRCLEALVVFKHPVFFFF